MSTVRRWSTAFEMWWHTLRNQSSSFSETYESILNRRGASVQSTAGSPGVRISGSNAGYTTFRGGVRILATHSIRQFSLHSPSRASTCAIKFQTQSNAGYTIFRGSVKSTGYSLHSPVSPLLPLPCVTVCHHISTGLYRVLYEAALQSAAVRFTILQSSYNDL